MHLGSETSETSGATAVSLSGNITTSNLVNQNPESVNTCLAQILQGLIDRVSDCDVVEVELFCV